MQLTMKEMIDEALHVLIWNNPQDTLIEEIKEQSALCYHVRFIICIKRSGVHNHISMLNARVGI